MSVAKGFRLSDDSTASLDWNYVTNPNGSKSIIEEVTEVKEDLQALIDGGTGLTEEAKQALLACFRNVGWKNGNGDDYIDALESALYPPVDLSYITCVYTQSGTVYDTDSLNSLKADLIVTAHYSDGSTATVTNYALSGNLEEGTSTVTVSYMQKTTSFNVTVTYKEIQYCEYIENDGVDNWIDTGITPTNTFGFKLEIARQNTSVIGTTAGIRLDSGDTRCWITSPQDTTHKNVRFSWNALGTMVSAQNSISDNTKFVATMNYKNDRACTLDGVTVASSLPTLYSPFTRTFIVLGKDNQGTINGTAQKFYGAEFTLGSDVTHKFVPAYKRRTGEIGLYEEIEGLFYGNDGTGTFTKGGDI